MLQCNYIYKNKDINYKKNNNLFSRKEIYQERKEKTVILYEPEIESFMMKKSSIKNSKPMLINLKLIKRMFDKNILSLNYIIYCK